MKNYVHPFRNQFIVRPADSNLFQQIIGLSFHSKGPSTMVSFTTFQVGKQILVRSIFLPLESQKIILYLDYLSNVQSLPYLIISILLRKALLVLET